MSPRARIWLACLALASASAHAQPVDLAPVDAVTARVLGDRTVRVKTESGFEAERRSTLVYDPVAGEYVRTVTDASGLVLDRTVRRTMMVGPSPAEAATAERLIRDELAPLIAQSPHPVTVSGGFPLVREAGHACGPGARCLMYDVFAVAPPETDARSRAERLRFVVVDLRTVRVLSADLDPAQEGNFANPEIRRRSRARDLR